MGLEDDPREGSVPRISDYAEGVALLEDLAWVDSCLVNGPEIEWNSLKAALLEILSSEPEAPISSSTGIENLFGQIALDNVEMKNHEASDDTLLTESHLKNLFQPSYRGEFEGIVIGDDAADLELSSMGATESSNEGIFKVWDLDIPATEDGFQVRLNKDMENVLVDDGLGACDEPREESLDGLIAGVAGISLSESPW